MDKNLVINRLEAKIKETKWDRRKNQYLLKRIKENKDIYLSDEKYLEKILKLEIKEKAVEQKTIQTPEILKKSNDEKIKSKT